MAGQEKMQGRDMEGRSRGRGWQHVGWGRGGGGRREEGRCWGRDGWGAWGAAGGGGGKASQQSQDESRNRLRAVDTKGCMHPQSCLRLWSVRPPGRKAMRPIFWQHVVEFASARAGKLSEY